MNWSPSPRYRWAYRVAVTLSCGHIMIFPGRTEDIPSARYLQAVACRTCDSWQYATAHGDLR